MSGSSVGSNVELNSNLDLPTRSIRLLQEDKLIQTNSVESNVELYLW